MHAHNASMSFLHSYGYIIFSATCPVQFSHTAEQSCTNACMHHIKSLRKTQLWSVLPLSNASTNPPTLPMDLTIFTAYTLAALTSGSSSSVSPSSSTVSSVAS